MSRISMSGPFTAAEAADLLRTRFLEKYALVEEKRRESSAFLLFEGIRFMYRDGQLLALDISSEGGHAVVDVFGYAWGCFIPDDVEPVLAAARLMQECGFTEHERESWSISGAAQAEAEREKPEIEPISPAELAKLGAQGRERVAEYRRSEPERVGPEKPKKRRGKRSYDPEL